VCITGGEPLRQYDQVLLLAIALKEEGRYVTIETDGQEPIEEASNIVDSVVMDWKLPSSGMNRMMNEKNVWALKMKDQLKFILATEEDLTEMEKVLSWRTQEFPEVLVGFVEGEFQVAKEADPHSPRLTVERVIEWMKNAKNVHQSKKFRFQIQLHKHIYGNVRGV
jgi:7-carboxy-7-deazaguanine synthase